MKNQTWLVGIANTEADGVRVYRVRGTKAQVKAYLVNLVKEAKEADRESFDLGSTAAKDVYEESDGSLNAYATFSDYHIDFTATPESAPIPLTKKGKEIKISGITLLTKEEAEKLPKEQREIGKPWWLRSPGTSQNFVTIVCSIGILNYDFFVDYPDVGVRPALKISNPESANLMVGDKFEMAGQKWTVINENTALCDTIIGETCFRKNLNAPDANDYEASDVKKWLEEWAKDKGVIA